MAAARTKLVLFAFLAGIVVPCAVEFGGRYLEKLGVRIPLSWSTVFIFIWPTGLWLIGTSDDWKSYLAFAISVLCNGFLYALIAFLICHFVQLFAEFRERAD